MADSRAGRDRDGGGGGAGGVDVVEPYNMHVSAKYLELTKRKLELTRLPHELLLPEERRWTYGTPKSVLEPLVDYWLTDYDWRAQERHFNAHLPQFRTTIPIPIEGEAETDNNSLRIHFVHQPARLGDLTPPRTSAVTVIPLLWCHDVPASSFLEMGRVMEALVACVEEGGVTVDDGEGYAVVGRKEDRGREVAFHVVAPSVPGMGFSEGGREEGFGVWETAGVFDALMRRLGYERYVAFGAGWGFAVCRALALRYGDDSCMAIHVANPASFFPAPSLRTTPLAWLKYHFARVTKARIPGLAFGYAPADFGYSNSRAISQSKTPDEEKRLADSLGGAPEDERLAAGKMVSSSRFQTAAYALCDSPVGLLAHTLDVLRPCLALGQSGALSSLWTPAALLNWTMMRWLPGPEAGLRWLQRAKMEIKGGQQLWQRYSNVPLGISQFGRSRGAGGTEDAMLGWAEAWQRVTWMKRREDDDAVRPEWERPEELVEDLKDSFGKAWAARIEG